MPPDDMDRLETKRPGFVEAQLTAESNWLDSILRKRYDAPFVLSVSADTGLMAYPPQVQEWIVRIVTWIAYLGLGTNPNDLQTPTLEKRHDDAKAEVLEAVSSEIARWDIPLATGSGGPTKKGPRTYTESSPYVFTDRQRVQGGEQDAAGTGRYG